MHNIVGFNAFWHPGQNTFGITIRLQNGQQVQLAINTPEEFSCVMILLNGPSPQLSQQGHVVSSR